MTTVYAVVFDNGLDYEDHWEGIVALCATQQRAELYIEEQKRKHREDEDAWGYPTWTVELQPILQ